MPLSRNFHITNTSFNAIRENKTLAKISESTVICILCISAEDLPNNDDDQGFKDLIKFWKKHGIPIAKDLLNDMDEETGIIITMTCTGNIAKGKYIII